MLRALCRKIKEIWKNKNWRKLRHQLWLFIRHPGHALDCLKIIYTKDNLTIVGLLWVDTDKLILGHRVWESKHLLERIAVLEKCKHVSFTLGALNWLMPSEDQITVIGDAPGRYVVVNGNGRVTALKRAGIKRIEVIYARTKEDENERLNHIRVAGHR